MNNELVGSLNRRLSGLQMVPLPCLLVCMFVYGARGSTPVSKAMMHFVSEEGVNRVLRDLVRTELHPYILKFENKHEEYNFHFFGLTVRINNISGIDVTNLHGRGDIKPGNQIEFSFGFDKLSASADITVESKGNHTPPAKAPTILHFIGASIDIVAQLGISTKDINITTCQAAMREFDASGEIAPQLRNIFKLAHDQISKLIPKMCPLIEDKLKKFYVIPERFHIENKTDGGRFEVTVHSISMSTTEEYFKTIMVPNDENITSAVFPPVPVRHKGNEFEIWYSQPMLAFLVNVTICRDVFREFKYNLTFNKTTYDVTTSTGVVNYDLLTTTSGLALMIRASDHVISHKARVEDEKDGLITVEANLAAMVPLSIAVNDVDVLVTPDIDLLRFEYHVKTWNGSYLPEDDYTIDEMQYSLMTRYNTKFELLLTKAGLKIPLPPDKKVIGFKGTKVKLFKDAASVTCNFRIGPPTTPTNKTRTFIRNKMYKRKYIRYTFTTGHSRTSETKGSAGHKFVTSLNVLLGSLTIYIVIMSVDGKRGIVC